MILLVFLQGWCPMCPAMGMWIILFWIVVIAAIVAVVWMVTRRIRR